MSRILVTGGAGFIGSHIVDVYLEAGHDVLVVDNLATGFREFIHPDVELRTVDIRSPELATVFSEFRPDVVNHLAAQIDVRRSVDEPMYDADVNIRGSINVLQQCADHDVKKVIFASTGGAIYGDVDQLPVSEAYDPKPICHYGAAKLAVEHYLYLYHHLYGFDFTVLRFPNVYGPRQNPKGEAGVCSILIGLMLEGKTPTLYGFGKPLRDYVYVGDIARGAAMALEKGDGETVNLGSGHGTSVMEIFEAIRVITGFQGDPVLAPLRAGEVQEIYISGERARKVLGWQPTVSLRTGLEATVDYVRSGQRR